MTPTGSSVPNSPKFTPGPWEYDGLRVDATAYRKETTVIAEDGTEKPYRTGMVALVYSCGEYSTHEGNGLLIAAAPELFAACNAVADLYPLDEVINDIPEHVRLCLAAIAKATRKRS